MKSTYVKHEIRESKNELLNGTPITHVVVTEYETQTFKVFIGKNIVSVDTGNMHISIHKDGSVEKETISKE